VEPIFSFGYPYLSLVPFDLTIKFGVVTHVRKRRVFVCAWRGFGTPTPDGMIHTTQQPNVA